MNRSTVVLVVVTIGCAGPRTTALRPNSLDVTPPCFLGWCAELKDHDSVGGALVCAQGEIVKFCLPRKVWKGSIADRREYHRWQLSPRPVFIGSDVPHDPKGKPLQPGSRAERAFHDLLRDAVAHDTVAGAPQARQRAARMAERVLYAIERNQNPDPMMDDWLDPSTGRLKETAP